MEVAAGCGLLGGGVVENEGCEWWSDPKPPVTVRCRVCSPGCKSRIFAGYDATPVGEKDAILRWKRLCLTHVVEWARARDAGALAGSSKPKGCLPTGDRELEALRARPGRLGKELAKAQSVIYTQGKAAALLGALSESAAVYNDDPNSRPTSSR
ncbi:hypothetical protein [Frankia sp. CiP1_Cm_nod2]|uniref:hypothetical protein n=1 Tax=Frankia sp. CiP1_Cm_nod2 TaxID=2897161 RepID=UPI0020254625